VVYTADSIRKFDSKSDGRFDSNAKKNDSQVPRLNVCSRSFKVMYKMQKEFNVKGMCICRSMTLADFRGIVDVNGVAEVLSNTYVHKY